VVARVRRLAGQKRVGHAGTLDPAAEGVLPVLLGRATRLADFVGEGRKEYRGVVALGSATATDDAEGDVVATAPVPAVSRDELEAVLSGFRGEIQQVPPAYSAVKVAGKRSYAVARAGGSVELAARTVTIYRLDVTHQGGSSLSLVVECSRGTYIRSLARDIARALGTVGHLRSLVRTRVGGFRIEDALTLEQIEERGVSAALLPPEAGIPDAPRVDGGEQLLKALGYGQTVPWEGEPAPLVRIHDPATGALLFVAQADGAMLRSRFPVLAPQ
jgi:tRNA pseudouridine55 synthase